MKEFKNVSYINETNKNAVKFTVDINEVQYIGRDTDHWSEIILKGNQKKIPLRIPYDKLIELLKLES